MVGQQVLLLTDRTTQMTTTNKPRRMARPAAASTAEPATAPAKRPTKQNLVLDLLRAEGGAPLAAIVAATDWLPHSARAALTGLRKQGHAIERSKLDGETRYAITSVVV